VKTAKHMPFSDGGQNDYNLLIANIFFENAGGGSASGGLSGIFTIRKTPGA
jgi:hypothetical protein